jgi:glycosyltransferase involved in cell wall biosynthesis
LNAVLLSAALIVRDEAEHLDGCLSSLRGLVDEIVVVDTGSSDASVDVAVRHGAIVAHEPWRGDFATPRNRSLDLATGEWILYVDADERVRAGDGRECRRFIAAANGNAAFRVPLVPRVGWTPYLEYRLWRHHPDVRFTGRMHESVVSAIYSAAQRDGRTIVASDVLTIEHLGYEHDQERKYQRDEPILLAALREHPERVFYYDHLARIYQALGRDAEAVAIWTRGIELARDRGGPDHDDRLLWVGLIWHQLERGRVDDSLAALVAEAVERFGELPALEYTAARLEFAAGSPQSAARRVERLLSLSFDEIVATGSAYDRRIFGEWAWNLLGLCRFAMGDDGRAAAAFAEAELAAPDIPDYGVRRRLAEARAAA